ncbi:MAG: hypothetical protein OXF88_15570 [Rhodobacteraceae bacterium]|nr:hypothetical protein [Paracoccaceae bacterium]
MANERSGTGEQLTTGERLDRINQAMVYFNRRQDDDLVLSQEMRLDFLQEFGNLRATLYIMAVVLLAAIVTMSIV